MTPSKMLVQESKHLADRIKAVAKERNDLRYRQKMFRRRIEKDLASMIALRKTWNRSKPTNPFHAVAVALNALMEDANA